MHFQKQTSQPPWLNRRDQYRLLGMVAALFLVVLAVDVTRRPENWNWFTLLTSSRPENGQTFEEIDYRVLTAQPPGEHEILPAVEPTDERPETSPVEIHRFSDPRLETLRDRQLGRLRAEEPVLQAAVDQARGFSVEELLQAGNHEVGFRVLNVEPDRFRGELISLEATLWKLAPTALLDQPDDGSRIYEAWIFTSDSGNNPWVVLISELPKGFSPGEAIDRRIRIAGYFLKRFAYTTEHGTHVAPLLAGNSFVPVSTPNQAVDGGTGKLTKYALMLIAIIGLTVAAMTFSFLVLNHRTRTGQLRAKIPASESAPDESARPEDFQFGDATTSDRPRGETGDSDSAAP